MAATAWTLHDLTIERIGDNTVDLDNHTFRMALFRANSNAATQSVNNFSQLTNQTANGNGYTSGGQNLAGVTWSSSSGVATFDSNDVTWNASGGSIIAQFAVIYNDTDTNKTVIAHSTLDPNELNITSGNFITVQMNSAGIFVATPSP